MSSAVLCCAVWVVGGGLTRQVVPKARRSSRRSQHPPKPHPPAPPRPAAAPIRWSRRRCLCTRRCRAARRRAPASARRCATFTWRATTPSSGTWRPWRGPPSAASSARRPSRVRPGPGRGQPASSSWLRSRVCSTAVRPGPGPGLVAAGGSALRSGRDTGRGGARRGGGPLCFLRRSLARLLARPSILPHSSTHPPPASAPAEDWNTSSVRPSQTSAKEPAMA